MTEAEWLVSTDPATMLNYLTAHHDQGVSAGRYTTTDRKLRLFACGCCRLTEGVRSADVDAWEEESHPDLRQFSDADRYWAELWSRNSTEDPSKAVRAALLRCVFGNPFRPARFHVPGPHGLRWMRNMAQQIYDNHNWGALPVLADALEGAGCPEGEVECWLCGGKGYTDEGVIDHGGVPFAVSGPCVSCGGSGRIPPLLEHLRGPGPHTRGCHVLDLLLNLE